MLNKLNSLRSRDEGFTLIELLVVVIIIGVLAAIAVPIFLNQQRAAVDASVQSDVRNSVNDVGGWLLSHNGATAASTTAYLEASGKLTQTSEKSRLGVVVNADGTYTVCGYNEGGSKFKSATSVFAFTSITGKFAAANSCAGTPGDATGNGSTGGNGSGASAPSAPDVDSIAFNKSSMTSTSLYFSGSAATSQPVITGSKYSLLNGMKMADATFSNASEYQHNVYASSPPQFYDKGGKLVDLSVPEGPLVCNVSASYFPEVYGAYFGYPGSSFVSMGLNCIINGGTAAKAASLEGGKVIVPTANGSIEVPITAAPAFSGPDAVEVDNVGSNAISATSLRNSFTTSVDDNSTTLQAYYTDSPAVSGTLTHYQNVGRSPRTTTSANSFFNNFAFSEGATKNLGRDYGQVALWQFYDADGNLINTLNAHTFTANANAVYTDSPDVDDNYGVSAYAYFSFNNYKIDQATADKLRGGRVEIQFSGGASPVTFNFGTNNDPIQSN